MEQICDAATINYWYCRWRTKRSHTRLLSSQSSVPCREKIGNWVIWISPPLFLQHWLELQMGGLRTSCLSTGWIPTVLLNFLLSAAWLCAVIVVYSEFCITGVHSNPKENCGEEVWVIVLICRLCTKVYKLSYNKRLHIERKLWLRCI